MSVNGIGDASGRPFAPGEHRPPGQAKNEVHKTEQPDDASPQVPPVLDLGDSDVDDVVIDGGEAEQESEKGVLRLLEEGHFKGVADVRLRINFFDELSARAVSAALPAVQEQAGDLVGTVNAQVDALIETLAVDEETEAAITGPREEFEAAVQAAVEEFASNGVLDRDALAEAIRSAFDRLVDELTGSLIQPIDEGEPEDDEEPTEVPADEDGEPTAGDIAPEADATDGVDEGPVATDEPVDEPGDEPVDEPEFNFDEAMASLLGAFDEALAGLLALIDSATELPDPSPPSGKGVAYDKFLAMYNELRGISADGGGEPPPEEPIDTTA